MSADEGSLNAVSIAAEVNACGPFVHEFYALSGDVLTHEGPLRGRSTFLYESALAFIDAVAELRGCARERVSVLEVGASDGWLLNLLWRHHGMRDLTGLEPRHHSIERGRRARELLGISDGVTHVVGDPSEWPASLTDQMWDVVLCFGVIHHLSDIQGFLNGIASRTLHGALFETLTLDDALVTEALIDALEPKDIIYGRGGVTREVSLCGVKLESDILWGSTVRTGPVMVPAIRALTWMLETAGLGVVKFGPGFEGRTDHGHPLASSHRQHFHSTVIASRVSDRSADAGELGRRARKVLLTQEVSHCLSPLPRSILDRLSVIIAARKGEYGEALVSALAEIAGDLPPEQAEIVRAIVHAPETKLTFEWAKFHASNRERDAAVQLLHQIVDATCDDWRTCYRAFYLLSLAQPDARADWRRLCQFANPQFPLDDLPGSYAEAFPA